MIESGTMMAKATPASSGPQWLPAAGRVSLIQPSGLAQVVHRGAPTEYRKPRSTNSTPRTATAIEVAVRASEAICAVTAATAAVARYDWSIEDPRLAAKPVGVDVGVVCLKLGAVSERRVMARQIADALIRRADELMYEAKGRAADHIHFMWARLVDGNLVDDSAQ